MMERRSARERASHWLTARFGGGTCSGEGCEERIRKGAKVYYVPRTKAIFATACGHAHAAAREAMTDREQKPLRQG